MNGQRTKNRSQKTPIKTASVIYIYEITLNILSFGYDFLSYLLVSKKMICPVLVRFMMGMMNGDL